MIRDPSDGSVREKADVGIPISKPMDSALPIASGLPFGSTKPEQQARLEKSRDWLKKYRLDQGTTEPALAAERSSETEE